jgi:hypothetical protein
MLKLRTQSGQLAIESHTIGRYTFYDNCLSIHWDTINEFSALLVIMLDKNNEFCSLNFDYFNKKTEDVNQYLNVGSLYIAKTNDGVRAMIPTINFDINLPILGQKIAESTNRLRAVYVPHERAKTESMQATCDRAKNLLSQFETLRATWVKSLSASKEVNIDLIIKGFENLCGILDQETRSLELLALIRPKVSDQSMFPKKAEESVQVAAPSLPTAEDFMGLRQRKG